MQILYLPGDPEKSTPFLSNIKCTKKPEVFKIEIFLDYQQANLNFDMLVLIFGCHLAEI